MSNNGRVLELKQVAKRFGGLQALNGIDLSVTPGEFVGVIGPNGAGKTTLFNVISGFAQADTGTLSVFGEAVHHPKPARMARLGIARTFQLVELFDSMTAAENVAIVLMVRGHRVAEARHLALDYLNRVDIADSAALYPSELPFPNRRRLELARALAWEPRILLADEVMAGLAAHEVAKVVELLKDIAKRGVTILAVEHNLDFVMGHCARVVVLDRGSIIADGPPSDVVRVATVIEAYLGAPLDSEQPL